VVDSGVEDLGRCYSDSASRGRCCLEEVETFASRASNEARLAIAVRRS